jgi:hypothetical protein
MASVFRALDSSTGKTVALKVCSSRISDAKSRKTIELFEREFHSLAHFAHPRVVAAYDYGVDGDVPYYSMELLDGGDLHGLAPIHWQDTAVIAYEICSALALLHSRGLVHRDITPRNIRRTGDGKAKLIDFGLLSPMGPTGLIAGTAPFVAPEVVRSLALDGRSDLFSLGAALYFALTAKIPYPVRNFDALRDAWRTSPAPPSAIVPDVPTAMDEIVLGMLRIDVSSRPKTAAEVMDRLLPLLRVAPDEDLRAAKAYLTTPTLVGRDPIVTRFREFLARVAQRHGGGLAITGESGAGRSRLLDAFVLEAKLVGATTVRAGAANAATPFGVASALASQLHASAPTISRAAAVRDPSTYEVLFGSAPGAVRAAVNGQPELVDFGAAPRAPLQAALRAWFLAYAEQRTLAIAVDDVDEIDEPSAAFLASLTWEAPSRQLAYAVTLDPGAPRTAPVAVEMLRRHAEHLPLTPLSEGAVRELLTSTFGDVPNLALLSDRLHSLCDGKPRECVALAQFLVDRGVITYARGSWTLPAEIPHGLLPESIQGALTDRISRGGAYARRVAALLALSVVGRLDRAELLRAGNESGATLDTALADLRALHLVSGDASGYAICHGSLARLITGALDEPSRAALHDALARIHLAGGGHPFVVGYHRLLGETPEAGLDHILSRSGDSDARVELINTGTALLGTGRSTRTLELALACAERAGRRRHDLQVLWVMLAGLSAQGEDAAHYYRVRETWLDKLKADSGWNDWQALDPSLDPSARAMAAVGAALQRFGSTEGADADRGLAPPDAIKQLVSYVVFSIAVAVRTFDVETLSTLPALLEPFAPLNPMVSAMLENAWGTWLAAQGKREQAHRKFTDILTQLDQISGAELAYIEKVRASLSQTLAEIDVSLGVHSVWVDRLSRAQQDPNQKVGAQYLRKVAALQRGDWEAAEGFRELAELYTLQSNVTPMFSTLGQELEAHAMARELTGLRRVREAIHAMAARHLGWTTIRHLADAHYFHLCGDHEAALRAATEASGPAGESSGSAGNAAVRSPWAIAARTVAVEILAELGRADEGLPMGLAELAWCESGDMHYLARGLSLAVARCEAALGRFDAAWERVERVIAEQKELGVTGLQLGRSYELGARIAVLARNTESFKAYSELAREQYRPGKSSVLGALYERLVDDARRAGMLEPPETPVESGPMSADLTRQKVTTALAGCNGTRERARRALELLCEGTPPLRGHLLLVTETGLSLAASNTTLDSHTDLVAFAQETIEADLEGADAKSTALEEDVVYETRLWRDAEGNPYNAVVLSTFLGSSCKIGGVAVLTSDRTRLGEIAPLAEALARMLIEAGDTRAIPAALSA